MENIGNALCIYRPGETNIIAMVVTDAGQKVTQYSNEPIQQYLDDGCEMVTLDEATARIKSAGIEKYCEPWSEITEDEYTEKLNVLPPEKWYRGHDFEMFRLCEYWTGDLTGHYARIGDKYYTAVRPTVADYKPYFEEIEKKA